MIGDLIKRLRYKYADILHLEAADALERLNADNKHLRIVRSVHHGRLARRDETIERLKKQRDDLWVEDNESQAKIERLRADYERGFMDGHACALHEGTHCLESALKSESDEPHPDDCLCDDCITPEKLAAIPNAAYSGDDLKVCGSCGCSEEDQDHD